MESASSLSPAQADPPGRRRALVLLVNSALALIGGGLAALLGAFALRPAAAESANRWIRAGTAADLPPGIPVPRVLSVSRADGWYRERARQTVFLVRARDGDIRAYSATCTHLGCQVRWDGDAKKFLCPCHGGVYDADGQVLEGPPPRPLKRIEARVEEAGAAGARAVLVRL
jgi:menaquinol-cytochrome c reductase iron-sulfur subunit